MEVSLNANMYDSTTKRIAHALYPPFETLSKGLSKDYGGTMQHLWIDFELIESHAGRRPPWFSRFQKKVGGSSPDKLTGLPRRGCRTVGHYSVRPDFQELRSLSDDSVVGHVLSLVYASTSVLIEKQRKLGGFDVQRFRSDFLSICKQQGHDIVSTSGGR